MPRHGDFLVDLYARSENGPISCICARLSGTPKLQRLTTEWALSGRWPDKTHSAVTLWWIISSVSEGLNMVRQRIARAITKRHVGVAWLRLDSLSFGLLRFASLCSAFLTFAKLCHTLLFLVSLRTVLLCFMLVMVCLVFVSLSVALLRCHLSFG